MQQKFKLLNKAIYFPEHQILAIGDLHLGYDAMLREQGIMIPFNQLEITKKEISEIIEKLTKQGNKIKKIILLGDIKHHFNFQTQEKIDIRSFLKFLEKYFTNQNIILIKGNHDKIEFNDKKYYEVFTKDNIAFTHGDKDYPELHEKRINTIVMSHIHPAITLKDKNEIKREKYKCFLIGKYKKKTFIIVPSFFPLIAGQEIYEYENTKSKWEQIIPKSRLKNFDTYIIGKDKVYDFGKLKKLSK